MKRSIVFSLLIIGAVVALVAGAGTFARFSTSDDDSGDVTATTLEIVVEGTGTLAFSTGDVNCPDNLVPGDTCQDTVTVTNNSAVDVVITDVTVEESGALEDCDGGDRLSSVTDPADPTGTVLAASGGNTTFDVEVTLDADAGNDCQGDTGTVTVTVTAQNT